jgi:RNA polymerase sigma-32 factor
MTGERDADLVPETPSEPARALAPRESRIVPADPFRRYLAEIRRYPPLDREEERELARRYRDTGDREALFRLVTANLRLVVRVAFSFRRAARNLLDLVQEGNLGLLHAIERFDPELGVRLPTYAAWWVRAYMVRFLLDNVRLVRVGTTNARRKLLRNLRRERQRLEALGYDVGPKMLAEHFDVSEHDVTEVQQALSSRDVSLDEPVGEGGDVRRGDLLPDERGPSAETVVARAELQRHAEEAIAEFRKGLGERDRLLLDRRILAEDPLTLQEIGARFGTTREAVRQAEQRLMKRLEAFARERLGELGRVRFGPD